MDKITDKQQNSETNSYMLREFQTLRNTQTDQRTETKQPHFKVKENEESN